MLGDKNNSGNSNSSTLLLFILMLVFFGTTILMRDDAEDNIARQNEKNSDSIQVQNSSSYEDNILVKNDSGFIDTSASLQKAKEDFGVFALSQITTNKELIKIKTPLVEYTFNTLGAGIEQINILNYKAYTKEGEAEKELKFFRSNKLSYNISKARNYKTADLKFKLETPYKTNLSNDEQTTLKFTAKGENGEIIEQQYTISGNSYFLDYNVRFDNFTNFPDNITVDWISDFNRQEKGLDNERRYAAMYWRDKAEGETDDIGENRESDDEDEFEGLYDWIAHKQQFFSSILINDEGMELKSMNMTSEEEDTMSMMKMKSTWLLSSNNTGGNYKMQLFHGPNEYNLLNDYEKDLESVIPYTWAIFGFFNKYFAHTLLAFFASFVSSYGLIIFLIALCVKLVISPFTYKTYLSSLKMKVLKPELADLKEKFKDDPQGLQMEQMKFYRQAGVNPLGGCLPMLFQMPILFSMYRFFPSAIELRGKSFLWADDLSSYDAIVSWSLDLPFIGNHLSLFTLLMSATTLMTAKLSSNQMPDQGNAAMANQMKIMQYMMPVIFIPLFNGFAAALSFYYFVMNSITLIQNFLMKRFLIDEDKILAKIKIKQSQPAKKSRFQRKMEEMMEQAEEAKKKK